MNRILNDNAEIYFLIEKEEKLLPDFTVDQVFAMENGEVFRVIVYTSASRNFTAFESEGYRQDRNLLPEMLVTIQEQEGGGIPSSLLQQAAALVEDKIHSKNNSAFYFDAH